MSLQPAIFGIESGPLNTVVQLVLLAVVVVWLALVWYTLADARRRLDDQMLVGSAVLSALIFPFLGTMVYMIVRPPEYLEDVRERELEMQAAEARLASMDYQLCPHCDAPAGRDFLRCPHCLRKLRDNCGSCARPLDPDWMICPYCETEIPGVTPQRRSRRRRARGDDEGRDHLSAPPPEGYDHVSQPAAEDYTHVSQPPPDDFTHVSQPPPERDEVAATAALEHSSQPPPSYEDLDRVRAEYEGGQPTQAFSEIPGDEPYGEGRESFGDTWHEAPEQDPGAPPAR